MRCTVAIVLIITLAFLLATLIFVIIMPSLPSEVSDDQLCVTRMRDDSLMCGHERGVLTDFLDEAIRESYIETDIYTTAYFKSPQISLKKYVDNQYWEMKPAARFTGEYELGKRKDDNEADMTPVRNWRNGRDLIDRGGFKRYGISLRNGRIAVPVTGTYFIYSYLNLFDPSSRFENMYEFEQKNGTIRHSMYKYNYHDNKETKLLTALTPPIVHGKERYNYYTSHVSGLVELIAGEEITMKVSNVDLIRHPETSFIGLNLV